MHLRAGVAFMLPSLGGCGRCGSGLAKICRVGALNLRLRQVRVMPFLRGLCGSGRAGGPNIFRTGWNNRGRILLSNRLEPNGPVSVRRATASPRVLDFSRIMLALTRQHNCKAHPVLQV